VKTLNRKSIYACIKIMAKQLWGNDANEMLSDIVHAYCGNQSKSENGHYSLKLTSDEKLIAIRSKLRELSGLCSNAQSARILSEMKRLGWDYQTLSVWILRQTGKAKRMNMLNKDEATKVITGMSKLRKSD
jgi:hypothetical protein